ncbi:MAG TPA: FHA domain-containing protein [Candidatus Obscuribacterales bacterium]
MIVCPNCNHQNPDGATQCEACYTPLPTTTSCPNCGASVQTDATFCGQCGSGLKPSSQQTGGNTPPPDPLPDLPPLETPDPLIPAETLVASSQAPNQELSSSSLPYPDPAAPLPATVVSQPSGSSYEASVSPPTPPAASTGAAKTQLQLQTSRLLHVQTNTMIELPPNLSVIHMGKPNDQIPPDIDVSGFPSSEIVSRVHADIRAEGDAYFIEDVGSANGTYVNHTPLPRGNRHRLRPGDRISLGKGDLMTFLFQNS